MACLKVLSANGVMRVLAEGPDGNVRGMRPGERIIGVDYACDEKPVDNLTAIFTSEGLMLGNLIKAVTDAVGIKQCGGCKGRQRGLNSAGLRLQDKIRSIF